MLKLALPLVLSLGNVALAAPEFVVLEYPNGLQVGGQSATAAQLTGRILQQTSTNTFKVPGLAGQVTRGPWHWRQGVLERLAPPDAELRALQQKYEGKRVYPRSTLSCFAGSQINLNFRDSARAGVKVLNVLKLAREQLVETRGFPGGGPYVKVSQPLALVFASQPSLGFASGSATGEAPLMAAMRAGAAHPNCARLTGIYANTQALERFFSLTPPPDSINNFKENQGLIGRTAEEALWLAGVPDLTPGTPAELYRLKEWHYSNLPGLGDGVLQFQNGRVISERWPRLP